MSLEPSSVRLERSISNALLIIADAKEQVSADSQEARQLDEVVRLLEQIDGQEVTMQ